jgi:hypothetical protein
VGLLRILTATGPSALARPRVLDRAWAPWGRPRGIAEGVALARTGARTRRACPPASDRRARPRPPQGRRFRRAGSWGRVSRKVRHRCPAVRSAKRPTRASDPPECPAARDSTMAAAARVSVLRQSSPRRRSEFQGAARPDASPPGARIDRFPKARRSLRGSSRAPRTAAPRGLDPSPQRLRAPASSCRRSRSVRSPPRTRRLGARDGSGSSETRSVSSGDSSSAGVDRSFESLRLRANSAPTQNVNSDHRASGKGR